MPYCHFDLLSKYRTDQGAGELRGVDFLVLRHKRVAGEGIVMFPARQRADTAHGGVDDGQAGAVAHAPDHPLVESRRDLAPLQLERAIRVEDQLGVVERTVIALVDAQHDDDAVLARRRGDGVGLGPGRLNGVLVKAHMFGAALHGR